jgi:hypothetical protein
MRKRARRLGELDMSETGTRSSSDARSTPTPRTGDTFGKLIRYERSLERSLFRTLDELRQLQDKRRNRPSSPISDAVTLDANDTL